MSVPTLTDIITGKDCVVNGVPNSGIVEIIRDATSAPIVHSGTSGGSDRLDGWVDFTGYYRAWGHTPATFPGSTFTLGFSFNNGGTNEGLSASQTMCTGLDVFVPTFDRNRQNGVYYHVMFGCCGYDLATDTATAGASIAGSNVKGLGCTFDGTAITCIEQMRLSFRAPSAPHPNSCTAGIAFRAAGPLDWVFTCRKTLNNLALAPALNATGRLLMYVEAAKYWQLDYGKVERVRGVADPDDPEEVIAADITIAMCKDGATVGSILDPAGATKWP